MTNEQLYLYLRDLKGKLRDAITATAKLLPEGSEQITQRMHVGDHGEAVGSGVREDVLKMIEIAGCKDETHFADRPTGQYIALKPLESFINQLEEDMKLLLSQHSQEEVEETLESRIRELAGEEEDDFDLSEMDDLK